MPNGATGSAGAFRFSRSVTGNVHLPSGEGVGCRGEAEFPAYSLTRSERDLKSLSPAERPGYVLSIGP